MYSMLIVDDEYEIRKGLEAYPWESLGIRLIGSCEHGVEAYERISTEEVNILLTDIRMPFMDGFELIQHVNRQFPYIRTIILTGYNDFSYAKQGIRLGIFDYLVKPIKDADLIDTFSRVKQDMDASKFQELQHATWERKAKLTSNLIRERFMQSVMFNQLNLSEIEEGCSEAEMILDSTKYAVAVLRLDRKMEQEVYSSHKEWKLILFVLDNILAEVWEGNRYGYYWIDPIKGKCFLLCTDEDLLLHTNSNKLSFLDQIKQIADNFLRFRGLILSTVSIGIGPIIEEASRIHLSCLTILSILDANTNKDIIMEESYISLNIPESHTQHEIDTTIIYKDSSSQHAVIEEAKRFIDQNFERSITLKDVAEHIHFNPNYLSSLFRKVTGRNYIHYLTHCRMEQAIKLLLHSPYKVYEICELVGYSTPAYFSDIFHKYTGYNPHEYRSLRGIKGDEEA